MNYFGTHAGRVKLYIYELWRHRNVINNHYHHYISLLLTDSRYNENLTVPAIYYKMNPLGPQLTCELNPRTVSLLYMLHVLGVRPVV